MGQELSTFGLGLVKRLTLFPHHWCTSCVAPRAALNLHNLLRISIKYKYPVLHYFIIIMIIVGCFIIIDIVVGIVVTVIIIFVP